MTTRDRTLVAVCAALVLHALAWHHWWATTDQADTAVWARTVGM